jgi:hypothetical protein
VRNLPYLTLFINGELHFTTEGLAQRLNLTAGSIARWRITGSGPRPYVPAGKHIAYPLSVVEAWEKERQRNNTAQNCLRKTRSGHKNPTPVLLPPCDLEAGQNSQLAGIIT